MTSQEQRPASSSLVTSREGRLLPSARRWRAFAAIYGFNDTISGHVWTFIVVQAATVVGISVFLYGLLRLS